MAFAYWLIDEIGVATVPGSSFYASDPGLGRGLVRFAFPTKNETFDIVEKRFENWLLVIFFDEREDLVRDRLVNAAEREHLGHVTLALEPHHRGTVTDSILCFRTIQLAKFVVYGDGT